MNRLISPEIVTPSKLPLFSFNIQDEGNLKIVQSKGKTSLTKLTLVFARGSKSDLQHGLSHFAMKLLLSGTKEKSANQIQEQLDLFGAFIETEVTYEQSIISLFVLDGHLESAFFYLIDCLQNLFIPESEWQLFKRRSLENLKLSQRKTSYQVRTLHSETFFGSTHPYGRSQKEEHFENIDGQFLTNHFHQHILPSLATIYSNCELDHRLLNALKNISRGTKQTPVLDFPKLIAEEKKVSIFVDDSVQSSLILSFPAIGRQSPEYPAFSVANTLFGGFFGSRLMKNIREDKGFTYGISSGIQHFKEGSLLNIRTDLDHQYVEAAINEIKIELSRLTFDEILVNELDLVKKYMMGSLQRSFDGPLNMLDRYKLLLDYNLPNDYFNQYTSAVINCTIEDVNRVVQRYFSSPLLIAIAGKV